MLRRMRLLGASGSASLVAALTPSPLGVTKSVAQQESRPAFVIVERTATTGDESIPQEYANLAREILPKYGARYLARSQRNTLLEGHGPGPLLPGHNLPGHSAIPQCRGRSPLVRFARKPVGGEGSPKGREVLHHRNRGPARSKIVLLCCRSSLHARQWRYPAAGLASPRRRMTCRLEAAD